MLRPAARASKLFCLAPSMLLAATGLCWLTAAQAQEPSWCAPEFETLANNICAQTRSARGQGALVIFLHGVIKPQTDWQHQQQRAIARGAKLNGFDVIMPRGRRGIGPKGMRDWWTWPTSSKAQAKLGEQLLAEWQAALGTLEARRGAPYEHVFVFGFSNGAYYASGLTLADALPARGSAVFAGAASGQWLETLAKQAKRRVPLYIEVGARDKTALTDGRRLDRLLARLGWPHRFVERPNIGHLMTDRGVQQAFEYLTAQAKQN